MSPPDASTGLDEWLAIFRRAAEAQGCPDLAEPGKFDGELEQLFDEGRTPDEAVEILHFS